MTTIKYKKSKREQSRSYSKFAFERYNKNGGKHEMGSLRSSGDSIEGSRRMHGLTMSRKSSVATFGESSVSDRAVYVLGRYVATRFCAGCYAATLFESFSDFSSTWSHRSMATAIIRTMKRQSIVGSEVLSIDIELVMTRSRSLDPSCSAAIHPTYVYVIPVLSQ
ncbi:hypothetical protein F2Q69_00021939 [Brassica cretica]|uniref:Uncharacterized protein n=1 Tax=Brassica cretica TaxID=69181 RepID=A0A8S9QG89_BRACR|nr:hypothetical protein F2Q69_00021939 [Brassica cretica]